MTTPRRIEPLPAPSTPAQPWRLRARERALPPDLLRQASTRLGIMALLSAVLWLVNPLLAHLTEGNPFPQAFDAVALGCAALSLALFAFTRRSRRKPSFILDLGLGYIVLTGVALGMSSHLRPFVGMQPPSGWTPSPTISWIGIAVMIYAAIVPTTPLKMLAAGLVAVAMNPISMLIALAQGVTEFGSPRTALLMHYPDFVLLGVAVVISHVVTQLGRQVARAREMGSYQLGELLGRGGMGEVYRATHRLLARPAAIKLIRPEMLGGGGDGEGADVAVKRFHREAGAAASLRSPHTVEVYDFGIADDGTLYFVMELLDGMDLETLVREHGPLPAGRVIHILRQVCDSLAEAHARGLVHRDIKPANIHLGRVGLQADFVKVLDFGLVKTPARSDDRQSLATHAGMALGTPAYMAPELAFGGTVDGRADLYALGCVGYFLLTGKTVFEGESSLQTIARHLTADPMPPSRHTATPVPWALEQLILSCLAKEPTHRPRSAAELAARLEAIEAAPWGQEQALHWWSEHGSPAARAAHEPTMVE